MSGIVSVSDIKNILSSIRRLATDDVRMRQDMVDTQSMEAGLVAQQPASLFFLTKALRVDLGEAEAVATELTKNGPASTARLEEAVAKAVDAEIAGSVVAFFAGEAKSPAPQVHPYEDQEAEAARKSDADLSSGIVDEVAMRELIGKLVRAELQGEFGDRISRNVRKLVRREIQRAISSIDLG